MRRKLLGALLFATLLGAGGALYLRKREAWVDKFQRRLARYLATRFYNKYPHITRDITYSPGSAARLDVYRPPTGDSYPVCIFVHGGEWSSGDKAMYAPIAERLLLQGILVVIPGYTLYPDARYRQQTREVAAAIAWTLDNVADYGGDPQRVVVSGHSAGAHLTALALLKPHYLAAHGYRATDLRGWVGMSGPYNIQVERDFMMKEWGYDGEILADMMEGAANFANASPLTHARPDLPPMLLIHGDVDDVVPCQLSIEFHQRLRAAGADSTLILYPNTGHAGLFLDALLQAPGRIIVDMADFVRACTGRQATIHEIA